VLIDLHTHSTASDGTDTPAELMAAAAAAGLQVIALTDHDTTTGWAEALQARPAGLTLVRGAEFSCVYRAPDGGEVNLHLLAYLFDPEHPSLQAEQDTQRASRIDRAAEMVRRLAADGFPITWEQVEQIASDSPVGRPHVARALVASGVVGSVSEAFAGPLAHTSRYHVLKKNPDVLTMIDLIGRAGGVTVFAHPFAWRRGPIVDAAAIRAMAAAGLQGVEVEHPDHDAESRTRLHELCADLDLIATGASDYHGANKDGHDLGRFTTSPDSYEALLALGTALPAVTD
jgi:predicted metal-dependent phosphoesterase TrpH